MWPDRRLCDLLGIDHPIIQAPMAGSATPELAIAVSNAGGLGSLGCAEMDAGTLTSVAERIRTGTNGPFNLNFFANPEPNNEPGTLARTIDRLSPYYDEMGLGSPPVTLPEQGPGFDETKLRLLLDIRPPVVSFHFGLPDAAMLKALKEAGIVLLSSATTVAEARILADRGVDAVIAQGWEAGGHRGSHIPNGPADGVGTLALVPQVVDAIDLPVIAAGGIGDGRGIAAAFALGASGVQIGTGFLLCPEAATDPARRTAILAARDEDTMVTAAFSGRSARARRSRYAREMAASPEPLPDFPLMYALSGPLIEADQASGGEDFGFHLFGQSASLCKGLPARTVVQQLVAETAAVFAGLGRR